MSISGESGLAEDDARVTTTATPEPTVFTPSVPAQRMAFVPRASSQLMALGPIEPLRETVPVVENGQRQLMVQVFV